MRKAILFVVFACVMIGTVWLFATTPFLDPISWIGKSILIATDLAFGCFGTVGIVQEIVK